MRKLLFICLLASMISTGYADTVKREYVPAKWPYWVIGGLTFTAFALDQKHKDRLSYDSHATEILLLGGMSMYTVHLVQKNKKNSQKTISLLPSGEGAALLFAYKF